MVFTMGSVLMERTVEIIMRVRGREVIEKEVKPYGHGAVVYVPKTWIGKKVLIVFLFIFQEIFRSMREFY